MSSITITSSLPCAPNNARGDRSGRAPGALANLAYRDALWPRTAYRRAWDALVVAGPTRDAARTMVGLLALAHDRGVEADLAAAIYAGLDAGELPDLAAMLRRFTPMVAAAPEVLVILPSLATFDRLIAMAGTPLATSEAAS